MKLGDSKAIKTAQWFANEILRNDDINFIGESTYQNLTDKLGLTFIDKLNASEQDFVIGRGLRLLWSNLLTTNLQIGAAISTKGAYLNAGVWGYIADPGKIFSVIVPVNQAVAFSAGGTFTRIDVMEIRPIEFEYNSVSRNFKDPITGLVSTAVVKTRKEYGYEFAVREGDDTTVLTKEVTTFTVNASTVGSDIAGKYILFSTIHDDYYIWYNTGASGDPAVSGRIGIEVGIGAADDDDAIALATRTAITVEGIAVSGTLGAIILTGTTYANLTDATNGDTGAFFDTIGITQGNGAPYHTTGWIKIAEITVGASASAISQDAIKNIEAADVWDNEPNETQFVSWPGKDISLDDDAGNFIRDDAESALNEIGSKLFTGYSPPIFGRSPLWRPTRLNVTRFVGDQTKTVSYSMGRLAFMAFDGQEMWITNDRPVAGADVVRVNVDTYGEQGYDLDATIYDERPAYIYFDGTYMWITGGVASNSNQRLVRIHCTTYARTAVDVTHIAGGAYKQFYQAAFDGTYLWLPHYDSTPTTWISRLKVSDSTFTQYNLNLGSSWEFSQENPIVYDGRGNLWIGVSKPGDIVGLVIMPIDNPSNYILIDFGNTVFEPLTHGALDGRGNIWWTTTANTEIVIFPISDPRKPKWFVRTTEAPRWVICTDGFYMYCSGGTSGHVLRFDIETQELFDIDVTTALSTEAAAVCYDGRGNIWATEYSGGQSYAIIKAGGQ